jgi:hypothetical protein
MLTKIKNLVCAYIAELRYLSAPEDADPPVAAKPPIGKSNADADKDLPPALQILIFTALLGSVLLLLGVQVFRA